MTRDEMILSLSPRVTMCARLMDMKCGSRRRLYEDFVSAGWIGAIQAVDRYNPAHGRIQAFAEKFIRGRILDLLREMDPLDRGHRRAVSAGKALEPEEFSIDANTAWGDYLPRISIEDQMVSHADAHAFLTRLDPRTAYCLSRHYLDDESKAVIAAELGICASRVGQIINWCARDMQKD